jgi:hypothetical protein
MLARAAPAAPAAAALPFVIDQAAHDVSVALVDGFNVSLLARYGVNAVAALSIDCATTLDAIPGGPWYDAVGLKAVNATRAGVRAMIAAAHSEPGVRAFLSSDLFQFPVRLLARYGAQLPDPRARCGGYNRSRAGCIALTNFTRAAYAALFDELVAQFPGLDGLVLRYGENSPCAEHQGNCPYDSTSADSMVASLQQLLLFLREELCVRRGLAVVFRTWDTSTQFFHANATFYELVTGAVAPHPLLTFSVKHTMLDFWRRVRLNPTLGAGRHQQVVEAEVGGMYGGCGTWPLYIGDGLINGYEEDAGIGLKRGLAWLLANAPAGVFAGVLTNHQCTDELRVPPPWVWWRLEQQVVSGWARAPARAEAELFDEAVAQQLGVADAGARAALRAVALGAMSANLRVQTCAAFDEQLLEVDRPTASVRVSRFGTRLLPRSEIPFVAPAYPSLFLRATVPQANSMLWDAWGGLEVLTNTNHSCNAFDAAHCLVFPFLVDRNLTEAALAEKAAAAAAYARLNASMWADVLPHVPDAAARGALAASVEAGAWASAVVSAGWTVMLLGYAGDRTGRAPNATRVRAAVAAYDAAWEGYRGLAGRWGAAAPGLFNDSYWQHPQSGVPGMRQSVARYRGL